MANTKHRFSEQRSPWLFWIMAMIAASPFLVRMFSQVIPQHWPAESMAELEQIRKELPLAEARWNAHNITDYEIDVTAFAHPIFCRDPSDDSFSGWHLNIDQGEIIFESAIQKGYVEICVVSDFLPPKVFDVIRQRIESANPKEEYLKIEFDPEYGFVTEYINEANNRKNSTLHVYYVFSNFRPKKP